MRVAVFILISLVVLLQYKAWFSDVGHFTKQRLQVQVAEQAVRTAGLANTNEALMAEVLSLKNGNVAIEAIARTDLGMIKRGEEFYFVPERSSSTPLDIARRSKIRELVPSGP